MDLGLHLMRALAVPLFQAWALAVFPLQLLTLTCIASCVDRDWLVPAGLLCLWWLKPVYERVFSLVLGHGLFGPAPTGKALYRALWQHGLRGLAADLSFRRFQPARSVLASVHLLERQDGLVARARRRVLLHGQAQTVTRLLLGGLLLEAGCFAGLWIGVDLLVPEESSWGAAGLWWQAPGFVEDLLLLGYYVLTLALSAPVFVAAGFGLYLNRRTVLEGWDVELTFRRMARRLAAMSAPPLTVLLLACGAAQGLAHAQGLGGAASHEDGSVERTEGDPSASLDNEDTRLPSPQLQDVQAAAAAKSRVLDRSELRRERVEQGYELRERFKGHDGDKAPQEPPLSASLTALVAQSLEIILWACAFLATVWVASHLLELSRPLLASAGQALLDLTPPLHRSDFDARDLVQAQALDPSDVLRRVDALISAQRYDHALSVLVRATLALLSTRDSLEVPLHATEGTCLALVQASQVADERRSLYIDLIGHWQLAAYAGERPEASLLRGLRLRYQRAAMESP